jgi:hypothetical protein
MSAAALPVVPAVHMYVDDAGSTRGDTFVVGIFATTDDEAWRGRFVAAQTAERYGHTLHFKKVPANPRDGRYRVSRILLARMRATYDWWGHYMYVDRSLVDPKYFSRSAQVEYNKWVADLIRWRTRRAGYEYHVTIAYRDRLRTDNFLPERLQDELDRRAATGVPRVYLRTRLSRDDDLLQIADLIASAVHQRYEPSGNALKEELGATVEGLVKRKAAIGNRRIYPFEWKPGGIVEEKKEG